VYPAKDEPRHFRAGSYTCPRTKEEVDLELEVPRAWAEWPLQVRCKACGNVHRLEYDDVRQKEPIFGRE
jgi:hypothetical protein